MTEKKQLIKLTAFAKDHLESIVSRHQVSGVVIALEKSGCAGYMYRIEPCQEYTEPAFVQQVSPKLSIYIPSESISRLAGSRLDYHRTMMETKAVFDNPNVQMACGCGESVELAETNLEHIDGK